MERYLVFASFTCGLVVCGLISWICFDDMGFARYVFLTYIDYKYPLADISMLSVPSTSYLASFPSTMPCEKRFTNTALQCSESSNDSLESKIWKVELFNVDELLSFFKSSIISNHANVLIIELGNNIHTPDYLRGSLIISNKKFLLLCLYSNLEERGQCQTYSDIVDEFLTTSKELLPTHVRWNICSNNVNSFISDQIHDFLFANVLVPVSEVFTPTSRSSEFFMPLKISIETAVNEINKIIANESIQVNADNRYIDHRLIETFNIIVFEHDVNEANFKPYFTSNNHAVLSANRNPRNFNESLIEIFSNICSYSRAMMSLSKLPRIVSTDSRTSQCFRHVEIQMLKKKWFYFALRKCVHLLPSIRMSLLKYKSSPDALLKYKHLKAILKEIFYTLSNATDYSIDDLYGYVMDAYSIAVAIEKHESFKPSPHYPIDQLLAIYTPFWLPILVPVIRAFRNRNGYN